MNIIQQFINKLKSKGTNLNTTIYKINNDDNLISDYEYINKCAVAITSLKHGNSFPLYDDWVERNNEQLLIIMHTINKVRDPTIYENYRHDYYIPSKYNIMDLVCNEFGTNIIALDMFLMLGISPIKSDCNINHLVSVRDQPKAMELLIKYGHPVNFKIGNERNTIERFYRGLFIWLEKLNKLNKIENSISSIDILKTQEYALCELNSIKFIKNLGGELSLNSEFHGYQDSIVQSLLLNDSKLRTNTNSLEQLLLNKYPITLESLCNQTDIENIALQSYLESLGYTLIYNEETDETIVDKLIKSENKNEK